MRSRPPGGFPNPTRHFWTLAKSIFITKFMNLRKYKWLRKCGFPKYTVTELQNIPEMQISQLRKSASIVIIDDELEKMDRIIKGLRNLDFNIRDRKDVLAISDVESFDIVICDIQGVASGLHPDEEGFGFIRQVAKVYPNKGIGVYSGINYTLREGIEGMMVIQKDDNVTAWADQIDAKIKQIKHPAYVWKGIAKNLINHNVPAKILARIEDDYVDRVKNSKSWDGFPDIELENETLKLMMQSAIRMLPIAIKSVINN